MRANTNRTERPFPTAVARAASRSGARLNFRPPRLPPMATAQARVRADDRVSSRKSSYVDEPTAGMSVDECPVVAQIASRSSAGREPGSSLLVEHKNGGPFFFGAPSRLPPLPQSSFAQRPSSSPRQARPQKKGDRLAGGGCRGLSGPRSAKEGPQRAITEANKRRKPPLSFHSHLSPRPKPNATAWREPGPIISANPAINVIRGLIPGSSPWLNARGRPGMTVPFLS